MTLKLVERSGHWHIRGTLLDKRVRKSTGVPLCAKRQAEKVLAETIVKLMAPEVAAVPVLSVPQAMDVYEGFLKMNRRLTIENTSRLRQWRKWGVGILVSELSDAKVYELVDKYQANNKPNTLARSLGFLSAAINESARQGRCLPIKIKKPNYSDKRDRHLDLAEIRELDSWLAEHYPDARAALLFLMDTGARLGEMLRVTWGDINGESVLLRAKANSKSRTRRVPLSERLRLALTKHASATHGVAPGRTIFCGEGVGIGETRYAARTLGKILRKWTQETGREALRVHDLRHTFAYQCAKHGCDLGDLQVLMGHSKIEMTVRYRGFIESHAVGVVGKFG